MVYRCIEEFELPGIDEHGGTTDNYSLICCDSLWKLSNRSSLTGADIVLDSLDYQERRGEFSYIEITKDRLESCFEVEEQ